MMERGILVEKLYCGDTLEVLKTLPDESVDLIITSPPYYRLRNYGVEGQIGLEDSVEEYLEKLLKITAELKRVLKKTGQLWWNMGDSYGGSYQHPNQPKLRNKDPHKDMPLNKRNKGATDKCLLMLPERLAIRMIDEQGWILRNKVRYVKQVLLYKEKRTIGTVLPTPVNDRFNESGEEFYFFVKSKNYWSNLDAVKIPCQVLGVKEFREPGIVRSVNYNSKYKDAEGQGSIAGASRYKSKDEEEALTSQIARKYGYDPEGICPVCGRTWKRHASPNSSDRKAGLRREFMPCVSFGKYSNIEEETRHRQGIHRLRGNEIIEKRPLLPPQKEFVDRLREHFSVDSIVEKTGLLRTKVEHWFRYDDSGFSYPSKEDWEKVCEAFQTDLFKKELTTVVYETDEVGKSSVMGKNLPTYWQINPEPHNFQKELGVDVEHFATFPQALVEIPIKFGSPEGGVVLDPFCGSGTTLVVAKKLGRGYIGIDINEKYLEIARKRLEAIG